MTSRVVFFIRLLLVNVYHYTQQLRTFNYWIHTLKLPMQFIYYQHNTKDVSGHVICYQFPAKYIPRLVLALSHTHDKLE